MRLLKRLCMKNTGGFVLKTKISVGVWIYTYAYMLVYFPLSYSFSCCCCCCFFCLFILFSFLFFSFPLFSHFRSDLREHNENKAFLLILCYPSHCLMLFISVCSNISTSTFNQFVFLFCLFFFVRFFVCLFYLG